LSFSNDYELVSKVENFFELTWNAIMNLFNIFLWYGSLQYQSQTNKSENTIFLLLLQLYSL
jgi:hypothetical protein